MKDFRSVTPPPKQPKISQEYANKPVSTILPSSQLHSVLGKKSTTGPINISCSGLPTLVNASDSSSFMSSLPTLTAASDSGGMPDLTTSLANSQQHHHQQAQAQAQGALAQSNGNTNGCLPAVPQVPTSKPSNYAKGVRDCSKNYELGCQESEEHGMIYEIACGGFLGKLHQRKFVCPGINSRCIQMNGTDEWCTPKEFVAKGGKESLKDRKRAIKIQKTNLRKLIESGGLDYYQHKKMCSNQCRSNKGDYLNAPGLSSRSFDTSYLNRNYDWGANGYTVKAGRELLLTIYEKLT